VSSYKGVTDKGWKTDIHPGNAVDSIIMCAHGKPKPHQIVKEHLDMHQLVSEIWDPR
jgi:hypothetical protein